MEKKEKCKKHSYCIAGGRLLWLAWLQVSNCDYFMQTDQWVHGCNNITINGSTQKLFPTVYIFPIHSVSPVDQKSKCQELRIFTRKPLKRESLIKTRSAVYVAKQQSRVENFGGSPTRNMSFKVSNGCSAVLEREQSRHWFSVQLELN